MDRKTQRRDKPTFGAMAMGRPEKDPQGPRRHRQMVRIHGQGDVKPRVWNLYQHGGQPQERQETTRKNSRRLGNIMPSNAPLYPELSHFFHTNKLKYTSSPTLQLGASRRSNFSFNVIIISDIPNVAIWTKSSTYSQQIPYPALASVFPT